MKMLLELSATDGASVAATLRVVCDAQNSTLTTMGAEPPMPKSLAAKQLRFITDEWMPQLSANLTTLICTTRLFGRSV